MYELANCFRNGWGVKKDPVAAKQYYETAANLGDTDAMNEVAWCYVEGFGCKKDKVRRPSSLSRLIAIHRFRFGKTMVTGQRTPSSGPAGAVGFPSLCISSHSSYDDPPSGGMLYGWSRNMPLSLIRWAAFWMLEEFTQLTLYDHAS